VVNALADVPEAERPHFVNLALGQNDILELIANGSPLGETLASLLRFLEREVPEMLCSVLLLDRDGVHLRYGAAPSLPAAYSKAIDGASIGPVAGSCGTAAYRNERVTVADIAAGCDGKRAHAAGDFGDDLDLGHCRSPGTV